MPRFTDEMTERDVERFFSGRNKRTPKPIPPRPEGSPYWTRAEAAAYLRKTVKALQREEEKGRIVPLRGGMYTKEILDAYMKGTDHEGQKRRLRTRGRKAYRLHTEKEVS
jgi:hypothetical protein